MCGINGIVNLNGDPVVEADVIRMNEKTRHRGPDDTGVYVDHNVGLGHNRLSIIDLSPDGHQPMIYTHKDRSVVLTYNGEIYNFQEIRQKLQGQGFHFHSQTDTEVIAAAYLAYGPKCIEQLNGMFSFVLFDREKQLLFGARDRFGKKPLRYILDDQHFLFSSEVKGLFTHHKKRDIDFLAIHDYLTLQYVPSPRTGFLGIAKLPPSRYFILDLRTRHFRIERYFDVDFRAPEHRAKTDWTNKITTMLDAAISRRLISDVPLGAWLSGGIDSSAVVALMSQHVAKVRTFSIISDHPAHDEREYARMVAQRYATDHHEFRVTAAEMLAHFAHLAVHNDEPFGDSSQLNVYVLAKHTQQFVTVALSGDGGDEVFGGYNKYRIHALIQRYGGLLRFLALGAPFIHAVNVHSHYTRVGQLSTGLKTLQLNVARRHYNFTNYFDEWLKQSSYSPDMQQYVHNAINPFEELLAGKILSDVDSAYYLDLNSYLPDDLNVKVDMASMAFALEVRAPFEDFELANLAARIPWDEKTGLWSGKVILKQALQSYLPKNILNRKKHGFSVPIAAWFRNELRDYARTTLLQPDGLALQIFQKQKVEELLQQHQQGRDNAKRIWSLLALNIWYNTFLKQT